MKNSTYLRVFAVALMFTQPTTASDATSISQAFKAGTMSANLRYRLEEVQQDNLAEDSLASTLRTRLLFNSGKYQGYELVVGLDNVSRLGSANYATPSAGPLATSSGPKQTGHPIVADPTDTAINELNAKYTSNETTVVLGRQRIIRGNSRFVGNVGWRQHEQTFDAITVENKALENVSIFAAYIDQRNTITFTNVEHSTVLLDAQYSGFSFGTVSGYYYDINVDNSNTDLQNFGLRLNGKLNKLSYALEFARQKNSAHESPNYYLAEATYTFDGLELTLAREVLASDTNTSFATPLATLHKFNGWSDQFLSTPLQGLQDTYIKVGTKLGKAKLLAAYHDFESHHDHLDFGSEVNVSATAQIAEKYTVGIKLARYSAPPRHTTSFDIEKIWLWAEANF